ncbi:MAG: glycosyltransferase family 4 protein [Jatrophihabitans sp.]
MRVLIVSWEFPPLMVGGLGRHVAELAPALAELGHEVRVLTRGRLERATVERAGLVTVHRAAADGLDVDLGNESVLAWTQAFEHSLTRAGLALLAGWRPEVIHAHDWLVAQTSQTLHQVSGAPVVVTMHATEHGRQQGWLSEPLPRAIHSVERWLCGHAAAVIACSQFMAGQLGELFGLDPAVVSVIGNGVSAVRPPSPEQLAGHRARYPGRPLVAFAGRLVHEKGVQELVKAVPALARDFPGIHVVIAGTGSQLAEQRDRAERYGVADRISWPGFLDGDGVHLLFAVADVVVLPSVYEPFGIVALEAQLAGTPVAVADTGGLRELVEPGSTGVRFAAQNPAAIAAAVRGLLADPVAAAAMAEGARTQGLQRFSWPSVAARTAQVYQRVRRPAV